MLAPNKKKIASFLMSILSIGIVFWVMSKYDWSIIKNITKVDFFYSILFAMSIFTLSGIQYHCIRKSFNINFKKVDIVLFPIVQNLWSILIPFQGSLIFSTIFFKKRYGISISNSFSISIYIYILTLMLTGLVGVIVFLTTPELSCYILLISTIMSISPILLITSYIILSKISPIFPYTPIIKIVTSIEKVINQTINLGKNKQLTTNIILLNIVRKFVTAIWFYWIAQLFNIDLSFLAIALISLLLDVLLIIKITPDNLGVAQLLSGISSVILGGNIEDGILLSLFASMTSLVLVATVGVYGNFYFFNTFFIRNLKK